MFSPLLLLLLSSYGIPDRALADEDVTGRKLPKIEAGVALLGFHLPDYPGADETRYRSFPAPYVIYRGEVIRADRGEGLRGRFFKMEQMEFDLSASVSFPAESKNNKAREGMKDLDWLGELGPRFKYHLVRKRMIKLDFELPLRYVFSTDFGRLDSRGYTVSPELSFEHRALFDFDAFFDASFVGIWATEPLMDYFYEVGPEVATAQRARYDAQSGFVGFNARVSLIRPFYQDWVFVAGVSRNFYALAENRGSPLLRDIETESYFMGLAWSFYKSDEKEGGFLPPPSANF